MNRVQYIDSNISSFATQDVYNRWWGICQDLDNFGYGQIVDKAPLINQLNIDHQNKLFLIYELYSNLYNMMINAPYDTNGNDSQMYITNEDYLTPGVVDMHLYDVSPYADEIGDFSMMLSGPAYLKEPIVSAIKFAIEQKGGTVRSIDIMETTTRQVWGFPIYSNYAVRVFWHGSPLVPGLAALIIYFVFAALLIIGVYGIVWQITKTQQIAEITKQVSAVEEINKIIAKNASDLNIPQEERAKWLDILAKSQLKISEAVGVEPKTPNKSPFGDVADIVKWVAIGLGIVMATSVFKTVRSK